jgi:prepilin-type N-terminal cleavage/methylation domain-containing protein
MTQSSTNFNQPSRIPRRSGFTLLELMIGMVITSLVMTAVAAVLSAVGQGWKQNGTVQSTSNGTVQTHLRVQRLIKSAHQLGAYRVGAISGTATLPAAIMMWKSDANHDNKVQFSELALLIHDDPAGGGNGSVIYYDVLYPTTWTAAQKTAADTPALADDEIYKDSNIDTFKNLSNVRATTIAKDVIGVEFRKIDGSSVVRPAFEYLVSLQKNGKTELEYGTVAVRTPTTLPTGQSGS